MKRQPGRPRAQAEAPRLGGACVQSKSGRTARATHHLQRCNGITVPQDLGIMDPNVGRTGEMRPEDGGFASCVYHVPLRYFPSFVHSLLGPRNYSGGNK